jgi:metal-dependent amidase/aminoacylase/carboxypeptidase family protein
MLPPAVPIIEATFAKYNESLRTISLRIHDYKELSFQEHRSARLLSDFLEGENFLVERAVAGDATAFVATYAQSRGPTVSFNAVRLDIGKVNFRNTMLCLI